ncbi:MAG: hypothetical protein OHK0029_07390 [Armatimonadaceae bacterium]
MQKKTWDKYEWDDGYPDEKPKERSKTEKRRQIIMYCTVVAALIVLGVGVTLRYTVFADAYDSPQLAEPMASASQANIQETTNESLEVPSSMLPKDKKAFNPYESPESEAEGAAAETGLATAGDAEGETGETTGSIISDIKPVKPVETANLVSEINAVPKVDFGPKIGVKASGLPKTSVESSMPAGVANVPEIPAPETANIPYLGSSNKPGGSSVTTGEKKPDSPYGNFSYEPSPYQAPGTTTTGSSNPYLGTRP